MKDITKAAYVYQSRTVAERVEPTSELMGAILVCAARDADKEVFSGFADVAGVECAGRFDRINLLEVITHDRCDTLDFTTPAFSTGTCKYRAAWGQKSCVFNESRIWILLVSGQSDQLDLTRLQCLAVCFVLSQRSFEIRCP